MNSFSTGEPPELLGLTNARLSSDYKKYAETAINNPEILEFCIHVLGRPGRLAFACSRVLQLVTDMNPGVLIPYYELCTAILSEIPPEVGARRTLIRIFIHADIPENSKVKLYDTCLIILKNRSESIACRAFSIHVLKNICSQESGLIHEAYATVKEESQYGSSGFKNAANKFLKEFRYK